MKAWVPLDAQLLANMQEHGVIVHALTCDTISACLSLIITADELSDIFNPIEAAICEFALGVPLYVRTLPVGSHVQRQ